MSGGRGRAPARPPLLEARELSAHYGRVHALKPTSLHVDEGELVTVLGPNGAGKTTLLRAITRLTAGAGPASSSRAGHHRACRRMTLARARHHHGAGGARPVRPDVGAREPHSRRLHPRGCGPTTSRGGSNPVFALFPRLRERFDQVASSLSGGEQQMLAVGRALMAEPKLLMLDEPSLGLAPRVAVGDPRDPRRAEPARARHPARRAEGAAGAEARQARLRDFARTDRRRAPRPRDQVAS